MREKPRSIGDELMPEAEVTLRLAFWLLGRAGLKSHADIAIDGAHVRIAAHEQAGRRIEERTVCDIQSFLTANNCRPQDLKHEWRGTYSFEGHSLRIGAVHGFDVQVSCDGKDIKAECKGGLLQPRGRSAAAVFVSAIGQVIVSSSSGQSEELWVAVPDSPAFENVGRRILKGRAFANTGTKIALVSQAGVRLLESKGGERKNE
jgi:hypothetical protein